MNTYLTPSTQLDNSPSRDDDVVPVDDQLLEQLRAGDEAALAELMQRFRRPIVSFCYRLLGQAAEADDVAQETFVRAYQARQRLRSGANLATWLFTIARNLCLDRLRYRKRHPTEPLENAPEPATSTNEVGNREISTAIAAAIAQLPEDQRTAVVLAEYHGLSYAEIAEIMKCSGKSVEARLYRARLALRQRLAALLTD